MSAESLILAPAERETLRAIVTAELPYAKVAVFGSRAVGKARPFSDLDLIVLEPPQLTWRQRAALIDAFEASTLPFRVELVEAAKVSPTMLARILAEAQPL